MGELVLLVVAAAWAAVLIPPLLRSRIENRPNSSVTDFRRQLTSLQRARSRRTTVSPCARWPGRWRRRRSAPRRHRPARHAAGACAPTPARSRTAPPRRHRAGPPAPTRRVLRRRAGGSRAHATADTPGARRGRAGSRERRAAGANVLFVLVLVAGCTLFLAATTKAAGDAMPSRASPSSPCAVPLPARPDPPRDERNEPAAGLSAPEQRGPPAAARGDRRHCARRVDTGYAASGPAGTLAAPTGL